jgi:glycosyltransferase involved in cell wall biosynthesis
VSPDLLAKHPDLGALTFDAGRHKASLLAIPEAVSLPEKSIGQIGMWHRRALTEYVEQLRPARLLLMYLDHAQFALATGLRFSFPLRIAGILFRMSLHYPSLQPSSLRDRAHRVRKRLLLQAAARNPHLDTVFTLDPSAAPAIRRLTDRVQAVALPDPVEVDGAVQPPVTVRAAFGVEPDRRLLLLFGSLAKRKGVFELLDALEILPERICSQISVLLAGALPSTIKASVLARIREVRAARPTLQLLLTDTFVPDDTIQSLVAASDLVLVPYQHHVGSSGVLIRAAAAAVPVLSQDYGVMGEQVPSHALGQTTDTANPARIAEAIQAFIAEPGIGFSDVRARAFANRNSVDAYIRTLFSHVLPPLS